LNIVLLRNFFLEKYKHNTGESNRRELPADAILLRTGRNGSSSPGSSWNTGEILTRFERPAIVVKGARMDNDRPIPDHDGNVQHSFDCGELGRLVAG
jgi:hypothetical protein